jgi:type II secretory pathway component GspD/PulD (secretin)
MIFLEEIYNLKYHSLGEDFYLIYSDEKTLSEIEELNSLINTLETGKKVEENENIVLKTNLFIINSKNIEIFGKICNEEKIDYKIIEKLENKNYVLVKANEKQFELLKNFSEQKDNNNQISIKRLITELSSFENKNVIIDFEDFIVDFNNFNLEFDDVISFLTSKGIFYKKIGKNTYSFFENEKILKYRLTIIAGDNLETNSIKDLYKILSQDISVINNFKDSFNNTYIVTKPEIYVIEGEFGELNSVLTIPVFEEKDGKSQVVDTIESGVKLKIKGNYDRDTDMIDTELELLLSEFSEENRKEESGYSMNQRSLITKLKMKNGSTIKAGNMNFSKVIEKSEGLSILKNIPVFGKVFYNHESSIRNYNIIIFLNIEIDNKAEDVSL